LASASRSGAAAAKRTGTTVTASRLRVQKRSLIQCSAAGVWFARTIIEPPAAGLLAAQRNPRALAELEANIAAAREAAGHDLIRYADLSAEFSMLITRHCGNKTLHLFASLMSLPNSSLWAGFRSASHSVALVKSRPCSRIHARS